MSQGVAPVGPADVTSRAITASSVSEAAAGRAGSQSSEPCSLFPEGLAWPSHRGTGPSSGDRPARLQSMRRRAAETRLNFLPQLLGEAARDTHGSKQGLEGVPVSSKRSRTGTPTEEPQARRPEVQGRWPAGTRGADLGEGLGVAGRGHTSPDTTLQGSGVLYEQPATLATA